MKYCQESDFEADPDNKHPGVDQFLVLGGKPTNGRLIFKLFSKGDQLKVKLAKLKFSEIGDGRLLLVFGGRLVIGRGD